MPTSQDNVATLINSYLKLLSQSQSSSTPPLTTPNTSSKVQQIYPNFQHPFQSSSSTLTESHHTPPGLPADLENLKKAGISLCDLGNLENQGKFFESLENIFLTWNFPFNQNLKIKIVSFN